MTTSTHRLLLLSFVSLTLGLSACSIGSRRGDVYSRDDARRVQQVEWATVENIRPVQIEGTQSGVGAVAGGVIGGLAGAGIGDGTGRRVASAVSGVVGAIAGDAVEESATRRQGMEITVRLSGGNSIAIVQEGDPGEFEVGQRVRILRGSGGTRVSP